MKPVLQAEDFTVTRNACKLCTPLGAVLAVSGIQGAMTILHGSQGCATYIRRYLISHFREPLDVASTSFTEHSAVFGGKNQLVQAVRNLVLQYQPQLVCVATTCLAETIGEDVPAHLQVARVELSQMGMDSTILCNVATPAYKGTHREGFQAAVLALVQACISSVPANSALVSANSVAVFAGMVSPADLRWLHGVMSGFGIPYCLAPDYSETMDGGLWQDWHAVPPGGTALQTVAATRCFQAAVELGWVEGPSAAAWLAETHGLEHRRLELPVGILLTDRFLETLEELSGSPRAASFKTARNRLADSYVDAHKYLANVPVLLYGEEDFVVALASWVRETGMIPQICASGAKTSQMEARIARVVPDWGKHGERCLPETDFLTMEQLAKDSGVRLVLGNSKGFKAASSLAIPHVRVGFPIHDRYGGQRLLHLGYEGAQAMFDAVVNALIEQRQEGDSIGYTYF